MLRKDVKEVILLEMGNKIVLKFFIFYKLIGYIDENCVLLNNF